MKPLLTEPGLAEAAGIRLADADHIVRDIADLIGGARDQDHAFSLLTAACVDATARQHTLRLFILDTALRHLEQIDSDA